MAVGIWKPLVATLVAVAALAAPALGANSAPTRSSVAYDALETGVVAEINVLRRRHGLAPVRISRPLTAAAHSHSQAMTARGFFSHDSANGAPFWQRIQRHYGSRGYQSWAVGENLAWASPSIDAAQTMRMWLNSPAHRRVLLTAKWREVGLAAVTAQAAPGAFGGLQVTVITADFGVRR